MGGFFRFATDSSEYLVDFCAKNCYDSAIKAKEARSWTTNSARASARFERSAGCRGALAQALEVSRQAVTKWEDGSSLPSTANLFALSGFFGVPLAELTGTPDGNAPASISEKTRDKRTKTLRIGAWVLLAVSVPVLLICAVQYFTAGPPIPEDASIVGGVDMATDIYVMGRFPSHLFLAALSLFVVGLGVLIGLKIKRWKGKTHDGQD